MFLEFGAQVSGPTGPKLLPTFEYRVRPDVNVVSPCNGTITRFEYQSDSEDYELSIRPGPLSQWRVIIDHLKNPTIELGDEITEGQVLGNPGTWYGSLGRTELMITHDGVYVAPFAVFDPDLKTIYEAKVTKHMSDWESFKSDISIYNESEMVYPGCLYETLTDEALSP